jgi:hypothetical protein
MELGSVTLLTFLQKLSFHCTCNKSKCLDLDGFPMPTSTTFSLFSTAMLIFLPFLLCARHCTELGTEMYLDQAFSPGFLHFPVRSGISATFPEKFLHVLVANDLYRSI